MGRTETIAFAQVGTEKRRDHSEGAPTGQGQVRLKEALGGDFFFAEGARGVKLGGVRRPGGATRTFPDDPLQLLRAGARL
jgi:hypothetical protein